MASSLMTTTTMLLITLLVTLSPLMILAQSDGLTPPYFNIAEERTVTVNATCGEGVAGPEVYCKLVGYDRLVLNLNKFDILDGQICDYCFVSDASDNSTEVRHHRGSNAVDGDISTWWQSPPISRGLKYNRVTLDIDLQQLFQVAYVVVTMANSPRPGVWALERSIDHGQSWQPWQFFAGSDAECMKHFGVRADEPITRDDQVTCTTEFSKVLPIEDGEVFVSLTKNRPSAKALFSNDVLQNWITATNIRLRLIQTKTMLGHLMSVAQGDQTVTRRYYYSIKEISVGGRCVCNGHAFVCPPSSNDRSLLQCQCQHHTAGINCDRCDHGFTQKRWRQYTKDDPFECEPCNCHGHAVDCYYDQQVDKLRKSLDVHGNYEGGGVCLNCDSFTAGVNCETCIDNYFRPQGVFPNDSIPCIPCQCDGDVRLTGNCAPESGVCECAAAFAGNKECTACADGYYGYPECKPCDCYPTGTLLQENGLPFCVAEGRVQCPCKENYAGVFCDVCAEGFYNTTIEVLDTMDNETFADLLVDECSACDCDPLGSTSAICNRASGQCQCGASFGSRRCDACRDGFYGYPLCEGCECDPQGTLETICDKENGQCLCKEGFDGERCDKCKNGFFGYPDCKPCQCDPIGTLQGNEEDVVEISCDEVDGQCPCESNFGGRRCDSCAPGYFNHPQCNRCNCDALGSLGITCDASGACTCQTNFVGKKCGGCAPQRYNYPLCEECNCNPEGVTANFFALGGCEIVPEGSLCTCKARVTGRICDTCKPLYFNLQGWNPDGCEECKCNVAGTLGSMAVCHIDDGQCECKSNVDPQASRICDTCQEGFFGLSKSDLFGCRNCDCDVGATQDGGRVCDNQDGQCVCRVGIVGRRCDEVQTNHYVPSLHQYKFEIEDGYRRDSSPVRIGYDSRVFQDYSWRGYAVFSPLQHEVLLDLSVTKPSVYRMLFNYLNPTDHSWVGDIEISSTTSNVSPITHRVLLPPTTSSEGATVTVSGEKGIYAAPFDLEPGRFTVAITFDNHKEGDLMLDYFVLLPNEYYEPRLLRSDASTPCMAGERSAVCRHFGYPDLSAMASGFGDAATRPGTNVPDDVYGWGDDPDILDHLDTRKLATLARWQPRLDFKLPLFEARPHVLAVVFFTPDGVVDNEDVEVVDVAVVDGGGRLEEAMRGRMHVFDCRYSSLCRQVVVDDRGRVATFDFNSTFANVSLENLSEEASHLGIDSVVAIPLEDWTPDFIRPTTKCVRVEGECVAQSFPVAPDQSVVVPFVGDNGAEASIILPDNIVDNNTKLLYVADQVADITGAVPTPGYYVLVANYYQPENPDFDLNMNITYANPGEALDLEDLMAKGQFHEAVLHLPSCEANVGCRAVISSADENDNIEFSIPELFHITTRNPTENTVWLESVLVVPSSSFSPALLEPERLDRSSEFMRECGDTDLSTSDVSETSDFCRSGVVSLSAAFNGRALDCDCDPVGSLDRGCASIGGQCNCRANVIGRQCTRCKPDHFGFPQCKQCDCPPTARCNEDTGDCICAPHVTGTDEEPCSRCEDFTFGYDPITGCQECLCVTDGTRGANRSCSLDTGNCFCKENVEGRTCDHCSAGFFSYPQCELCPCDARGTTEDICDQTTAKCLCKPNVEGDACDQCESGKFNLEESNPDGCTDCFCFGKTTFCRSHDAIQPFTIASMDGWSLTSLTVARQVSEQSLSPSDFLPQYDGQLAVGFEGYEGIDLTALTSSFYFSAPKRYLGQQIFSYGNTLDFELIYSGYELDGAPSHPDVVLRSQDDFVLFHAGVNVLPNTPTNFSVPLEPYYWVTASGAPIDRARLMVILANLDGLFVRASYGLDGNGQARLARVKLGSAQPAGNPANSDPDQDLARVLGRVELCECPPGYHGSSCESCALGYYQQSRGPFGPICVECNCHGHADVCHPLTGQCVALLPLSDDDEEYSDEEDDDDVLEDPEKLRLFCHFHPEQCIVNEDVEPCRDNTTGPQCEMCAEGFYGDATRGSVDDCQSCPCPLPQNNFAKSCDGLFASETTDAEAVCECRFPYVGARCEQCGAGHYGQPELPDGFCQPCKCNDNIDTTSLSACDRVSGLCLQCMNNTTGDKCERCDNGFFGDAIDAKNCRQCACDQRGTAECNHFTGECECLPGVDGENCTRCLPNHWGFDTDPPGCTPCDCGEASEYTQCDQSNGQCRCKPGATGQKCDRCVAGFWNLGPEGCESCGCNTEFAVGGTCDQETGQCECLEGVIGQNCDHCPDTWVLVVNETRTQVPEWKLPFDYTEGCFPCSSCVADLLQTADQLNDTLAPVVNDFKGVESSFFAFKRLRYIEQDAQRLQPEIELLNPQEGSRRLEPLESAVENTQKVARGLNVDYKLNLVRNWRNKANELRQEGFQATDQMRTVQDEMARVSDELQMVSSGLGGGVTAEQLEAAAALGDSWLDAIRSKDFTEEREMAMEKQEEANSLMSMVKDFSQPVADFKQSVTKAENRVSDLDLKLDDLRNQSINAMALVRQTKALNFRNSEPPATFKVSQIGALVDSTTSNNNLGLELVEDAQQLLEEAKSAMESVGESNVTMSNSKREFETNTLENEEKIDENYQKLYEAEKHARDLEMQADELKATLVSAKAPVSRVLDVVNAYQTITNDLDMATNDANEASTTAESADNMSQGVTEKAQESRERTQQLYDAATLASEDVDNELRPMMSDAQQSILVVQQSNKDTKNALDAVAKGQEGLGEVSATLSSTQEEADDAETLAHDALASIDARAAEISASMKKAQSMQDDFAELKFSLDAANEAMAEVDNRALRRRRQAGADEEEEEAQRMRRLQERSKRIRELSASVGGMIEKLKQRIDNVKQSLTKIDVGMSFSEASNLELEPPSFLSELSLHTSLRLHFKVSRSRRDDDRAFLLYVGNEVDAHLRRVHVSSDDYLAIEIVQGGRVKLTIDLGAGATEMLSNRPIVYDAWNELKVNRRGSAISMEIITEDAQETERVDRIDELLPKYDEYGRPFGSVFNVDATHSRIFIGGFPPEVRIQETVRETFMEGEIEGLIIADTPVGLWNYKEAKNVRGVAGRKKFVEVPVHSIGFSGNGFFVLDANDFVNMDTELSIKLKVKSDTSEGLVFVFGSEEADHEAALSISDNRLNFKLRMKDLQTSVEASKPLIVGQFANVVINRNDNQLSLAIDDDLYTEEEIDTQNLRLEISGPIYLGGQPDASVLQLSRSVNLSGCIEDVFFGLDRADLTNIHSGVALRSGCALRASHEVTFAPDVSGFLQLTRRRFYGTIEVSFLFKTGRSEGLLLYMSDANRFFYLSIAVVNDAIELRVFPRYELRTERRPVANQRYNDNHWHAVSIVIRPNEIQFHIDDYEYLKATIENAEEVPGLNEEYDIVLGGLPSSTTLISGSVATETNLVGCVRDVIIDGSDLVDFNQAVQSVNAELNVCVSQPIPDGEGRNEATGTSVGEESLGSSETIDSEADVDDVDALDDDEDEVEVEDGDDSLSSWDLPTPSSSSPEIYGDCALPVNPQFDPEVDELSGLRFGTRRNTYLEYNRRLKVKKRSEFSVEFRTSFSDGIVFYAADSRHSDFIALFMKNGKLVYGFNCGSGSGYIESNLELDDDQWHVVHFSRQGNRGKLVVDGDTMGEQVSFGTTKIIEVESTFFVGGLNNELSNNELVVSNLQRVKTGFVGCLRSFTERGRPLGQWSKNNKEGVVACSSNVEDGFFFGNEGGFIHAYKKFRVGLDFDVTMDIKPRNVSGILLAIQGRRDYLILEMVDGTLTFTVDNGRGPITAYFRPGSQFQFCDGNWHSIHAVKAKNVVTLSVDDIFAQPGIGVPGVSSTDTNHGLFIGGHPRVDRLSGRASKANFVGCLRRVVVEGVRLDIATDMIKGDVLAHVCPTI